MDKILLKLKKELKKKYPARHWNHCDVLNAYWKLVDTIKEGE